MTAFVLPVPDPPTEEELKNPAFQWTCEMGYGYPSTYICGADFHDDILEPWVCEPCEHCGADITGIDYHPPEEQSLGPLKSLIIGNGYYVVHPCGHTISEFTLTDFSKKRS